MQAGRDGIQFAAGLPETDSMGRRIKPLSQ
jgi:hypothetical protein